MLKLSGILLFKVFIGKTPGSLVDDSIKKQIIRIKRKEEKINKIILLFKFSTLPNKRVCIKVSWKRKKRKTKIGRIIDFLILQILT